MFIRLSLCGLLTLALAQGQWQPKQGVFPPTADDTIAGGIFSISLPDLASYLARNGGMANGPEAPKGNAPPGVGSGPYAAHMFTDPSLPKHTLYAPKSPPDVSMPFIAWGNGACGTNGAGYQNFLIEIASYGYVIAADGAPGAVKGGGALGAGLGSSSGQSKISDMRDSIKWAVDGKAAKYGKVDLEKIATAGHSCGGLEAMSNSYHNYPQVKLVMLFDIAIFQDNKRYLLKELKAPVAYFIGGPKDMAYPNAAKDYNLLPEGLPAYYASLDSGHMGTYYAANGGKFGKAAVAYLEWQFRNNATAKSICLDKGAAGSLSSDKWDVKYKNWK